MKKVIKTKISLFPITSNKEKTMNCNLEHYLQRSHEWFCFLCEHEELRTKRLIRKLYNNYMLSVGHYYILSNNTIN